MSRHPFARVHFLTLLCGLALALLCGCELFKLPFALVNPHDPMRSYRFTGIAGRDPYEDRRGIAGLIDLAVTPDGSLFIATQRIRGFFWFGPGEAAHFVPLDEDWGNCIGVAYNAARGRFALSCDRGIIEVDPATVAVESIHRFDPESKYWFEWIAAGPDGSIFVTKQWDEEDGRHQSLERIDPSTGQRVASFDLSHVPYLRGIAVSADRIILSAEGAILFYTFAFEYVQEIYWNITFQNQPASGDIITGGLDPGKIEYDAPSGRLFYSSYNVSPVCSLDPADYLAPLKDTYGQYSEYPDARSNPVCRDASGRLYVGNGAGMGFVHRFDAPAAAPSATIYQSPPLDPDETMYMDDLACDPSGELFFPESSVDAIKRFSPATGTFSAFAAAEAGWITANADHVYVSAGDVASSYTKAGVFEESWPALGSGIVSLTCTSANELVAWCNGAQLYILTAGGVVNGPYQPLSATPYAATVSDAFLDVTGTDHVVLAIWGNDVSDNSYASFGTVDLGSPTYSEIWNTYDAGLVDRHPGQRDIFAVIDTCVGEGSFVWMVLSKLSTAVRFELDGTVLGSMNLHRSGSGSFGWTPSEIVEYRDTTGGWWAESCERIAADSDGTLFLKYNHQIYQFEPR